VLERRLSSDDVLHCLTDLFIKHCTLEQIRSDNGPEFTAKAVRAWLGRIGVKTLFIKPGSPWENCYISNLGEMPKGMLRIESQFDSFGQGGHYLKMKSIIGGVPEKYRFVAETLILTQPARPASNFFRLSKALGLRPGRYQNCNHIVTITTENYPI